MTVILHPWPLSNRAMSLFKRCVSPAGWLCSTWIVACLASCAMPARPRPVAPSSAGVATLSEAAFAVGGEIARPQTFTIAALEKMSRKSVRASAHEVEGEWEGVPLLEILRMAGAPVDAALRGKNLSLYVRISASDGYQVVYALAELDPKFRDDDVLLADHHNGELLGADEGPFRIIAPREQRPGRWVRQVVRIDVLRAPD